MLFDRNKKPDRFQKPVGFNYVLYLEIKINPFNPFIPIAIGSGKINL